MGSYEILHESLLRAASEDRLLPPEGVLLFGVLYPLAHGDALADPAGD